MKPPLVQPYLFFGGRCDEALEFYQKAVGAKVEFLMRYNENPGATVPGSLPPGFENKVMHCTFQIGQTTLMASDGNETPAKFSGFKLSLALATEAEAQRSYAALAEGGQADMPLTKTFWSPCFGMLTDRFGIEWMIGVISATA